MRRALATPVIALAIGLVTGLAAAPAEAGTARAEFALRVETGEASVDAVLGGHLRDSAVRVWTELDGSNWDVALFGPFDVIRRAANLATSAPLPDEIALTVVLDVEGVPSESAAAHELARRLMSALLADIQGRLQRWRTREIAPSSDAERRAAEQLTFAQARLVEHRREWGDAATEHALTATRLGEASAGLARARVDRAVAAARLEAARAAVELAAELDELRTEVATLEAAKKDVPAALRAMLAEASKRAAPIDDARRTAFDLEVELVGLEARIAALEPEITELRARVIETARARAESDSLNADLVAAHDDATSSRRALRTAQDAAGRVAVHTVRPLRTTPQKR